MRDFPKHLAILGACVAAGVGVFLAMGTRPQSKGGVSSESPSSPTERGSETSPRRSSSNDAGPIRHEVASGLYELSVATAVGSPVTTARAFGSRSGADDRFLSRDVLDEVGSADRVGVIRIPSSSLKNTDSGLSTIVVIADGYATAQVAVGGAMRKLHIVLHPHSEVAILCKTVDGRPLADVRIAASRSDVAFESGVGWPSPDGRRANYFARTDMTGTATLRLPPGDYHYETRHPTAVAIDGGPRKLAAPGTMELRFASVLVGALRIDGEKVVSFQVAPRGRGAGTDSSAARAVNEIVRPLRAKYPEQGGHIVFATHASGDNVANVGATTVHGPGADVTLWLVDGRVLHVPLYVDAWTGAVDTVRVQETHIAMASERRTGRIRLHVVEPTGTQSGVRNLVALRLDGDPGSRCQIHLEAGEEVELPEGRYLVQPRDSSIRHVFRETLSVVNGDNRTVTAVSNIGVGSLRWSISVKGETCFGRLGLTVQRGGRVVSRLSTPSPSGNMTLPDGLYDVEFVVAGCVPVIEVVSIQRSSPDAEISVVLDPVR